MERKWKNRESKKRRGCLLKKDREVGRVKVEKVVGYRVKNHWSDQSITFKMEILFSYPN